MTREGASEWREVWSWKSVGMIDSFYQQHLVFPEKLFIIYWFLGGRQKEDTSCSSLKNLTCSLELRWTDISVSMNGKSLHT